MFDSELTEFIEQLGMNAERLEEYYPKLGLPLAKPSQFGIGAREFFYWVKQGIIDVKKTETNQAAWNRLNLYDAVWIRIIQELRSFNFPFKGISIIKDHFFKDALEPLRSWSPQGLEQILQTKISPEVSRKVAAQFQQIQSDQPVLDMNGNVLNQTVLAGLLYDIIVNSREIKIHISMPSGNFMMFIEGITYGQDLDQKFDQETHLTINLNKILADFLLDTRFEKVNKEFGFISEDEKTVLAALENPKIREIHIKKDESEDITIRLTSRTELRDENAKRVKKILRMNEFSEVRVVTRTGNHVILENTKKIKFKDPMKRLSNK